MIPAIKRVSLAILLSGTAFTQSIAPSLEVASVRKHLTTNAQNGAGTDMQVSGNRVSFVDSPFSSIVLEAYDLKPYQLEGDADWMGGGSTISKVLTRANRDTYDISAKAAGATELSRAQARLIIQAVLAERFNLKVHRETKMIPVYELAVGKNGAKLKESAPDARGATFEFGALARFTNRRMTTAQLAEFLARQADRPVVDKSGLTGFYDIKLEWSFTDDQQAALATLGGGARDTNPAGPSLFTAVQEQLGLVLEPSKAPMQVLVIDHVERPSEN